jgi:TrpR-related protein YerC/YecD
MTRDSSKITQNKKARALYSAVMSLQNPQECAQYFRDLLTEEEIGDLAERWYVVQCLDKGLSYREIGKLTGLSSATITRVAKWFRAGTGGYRIALERQP